MHTDPHQAQDTSAASCHTLKRIADYVGHDDVVERNKVRAR